MNKFGKMLIVFQERVFPLLVSLASFLALIFMGLSYIKGEYLRSIFWAVLLGFASILSKLEKIREELIYRDKS